MFRQFARLPLRRCLHSQASASPRTFSRHNRSAYALGASVAVAGYLAWSLSSNGRHLSLDAEPVPTPKKRPAAPKTASSQPSDAPTPSTPSASQNDALPELDTTSPESEKPSESTPEAPETPAEGEGEQGESSAGGAFNPETGEINWDCPCLGGMAHGPCGEQFREAFSCFVHSEAEPKGVDCVGKFKAMQDCFREHPDVYGDEIMDDDDDDEELPAGAVTTDSENPEGQTTLADTPSAKTSEHESPSPSS